VDPLLERRKLPSAASLPPESLSAFAAARDEALAQLVTLAAATETTETVARNTGSDNTGGRVP